MKTITGMEAWTIVGPILAAHSVPYNISGKRGLDAPVNMIWAMNAEELCVIANKRLCNLAAKETREVVSGMCKLVVDNCPEFADVLVPACVFNGKCHEMRPCGKFVREES